MKHLKSDEIRALFLKYFEERGHEIVPSAPIVVKNDPTLMFTNAGMNQFKDLFLGNKPIQFHRVADTQKCLRVSGKHNDLEEVGVDTYHHTMFEMLGNWSFGSPDNPTAGYFKKEAIAWSWDLLHNVYGIEADRFYVTVFEGDESQNIPMDQEAYDEWKKYLPENRILMGSKKDNFWEMGDTGPCGPCTEVHVDCRPDAERDITPGHLLVNQDDPQVIEIWNNVFIQFNRLKDGSLDPLPAKHVDTGMGYERLVRVLQNKQSNYDTDIFTPTIDLTAEITKVTYKGTMEKSDIAFRVIADHIRAICFTIADGQIPSNTGAGYVIRRILRRAVRYYFSFLNHREPLLTHLVKPLANQFAHVFPELNAQQDFVAKVIFEEETSFLKTLDTGIKRFEQISKEVKDIIPGAQAFELMDTFGFPIDLSRLMAREIGFEIDEKGFELELQKQKDRSRAASKIDNDDWTILAETDESIFKGYDSLQSNTRVVKYRKYKQKEQEGYQIVLAETPFYAESGGQVGDTGVLSIGSNKINVLNTKKENELILHFTDTIFDEPNGVVSAAVDGARRHLITLNHTATHLMHAALRQVLGKHVVQKGSLVNERYLRFDFSHFAKLTADELNQVETIVNQKIRANIPVIIRWMDKEEAMKTGAMALFGEKYGSQVRVVTIDPEYSIELCGGTHVSYTGQLGLFKITSEAAIASGVRRIEAVSGQAALDYVDDFQNRIGQLMDLMNNPKDLYQKITELIQVNKSQEKSIELYQQKEVNQMRDNLLNQSEVFGGINVIRAFTEISDGKTLKSLGVNLAKSIGSGIIIIGNSHQGKANLQINITDDLIASKGLNAGGMVKEFATFINGGGGGQPNFASAGGTNPNGLKQAIDLIIEQIKTLK